MSADFAIAHELPTVDPEVRAADDVLIPVMQSGLSDRVWDDLFLPESIRAVVTLRDRDAAGFDSLMARLPVQVGTTLRRRLHDYPPTVAPGGGEPILVELDESEPLRPMSSLIRGILPADAVGMLWGAPGSYKSFLALDWALCIASGTPWLGNEVKHRKAWYLAGEGHNALRHRVSAWRQARNYDGPLRFLFSQRSIMLDVES